MSITTVIINGTSGEIIRTGNPAEWKPGVYKRIPNDQSSYDSTILVRPEGSWIRIDNDGTFYTSSGHCQTGEACHYTRCPSTTGTITGVTVE